MSDDILAKAFRSYGSFQRARVVRHKHNNKSKGFGFVSFKHPDDFAKAIRDMNGMLQQFSSDIKVDSYQGATDGKKTLEKKCDLRLLKKYKDHWCCVPVVAVKSKASNLSR